MKIYIEWIKFVKHLTCFFFFYSCCLFIFYSTFLLTISNCLYCIYFFWWVLFTISPSFSPNPLYFSLFSHLLCPLSLLRFFSYYLCVLPFPYSASPSISSVNCLQLFRLDEGTSGRGEQIMAGGGNIWEGVEKIHFFFTI